MRIVLLTAEYPPQPGGVGDYTRCLGQTLTTHGADPLALTIHDERMAVYAPGAAEPVAAAPIGVRPAAWSWGCWRDIIAAIDRLRPAVLHIQYQTGAYAMHPAINLLPWRLHHLPGRPAVAVTFHDLLEPYLFPKASLLRRYVTRRLAADADAVIVTNAADAAVLQQTGAWGERTATTLIPIGSNIAVAPPPDYDRRAWRDRLGVRPDQALVAYFGLLSASKGVDLLLEAIATGREQPPARLLLIGGAATAPQDRAYAAAVAAQIERLGLRDRVIITGTIDAPTVSAHLLAADSVALPFRDGASFRRGSLLAALSHGCAVITTSGPAASGALALRDGVNALLTPPGDRAALGAALARLAANPPLRARLGAAARDLAAHFGWDAIARQHIRLYESLVRR